MRLALAFALAVLATPALAEPLARVTGGDISIRSGPGMRYDISGRLHDGSRVALDYCTRNDRWCFIANTGWVDASYLVGWSAKIRATPPVFLNPFGRDDDDDWPGW